MPVTRRQLLAGVAAAGASLAARTGRAADASAQARRDAIVVDTHAHYFPEEWVRLVEREGGSNGARIGHDERGAPTFSVSGMDATFTPPFMDLALRLKAMDEKRVQVHALSLTSPMVYWAPAPFGLRLAQVFNDACSAAHARHPSRFVGMATLPMQAPELALRELERAAKLPGLRGLYLGTHVQGRNLDEKEFFPVYARCEALGWPIFLHPLNPVGADRMPRWYLRNLLGNPYDTGIAAASLVFGGVLDTFPNGLTRLGASPCVSRATSRHGEQLHSAPCALASRDTGARSPRVRRVRRAHTTRTSRVDAPLLELAPSCRYVQLAHPHDGLPEEDPCAGTSVLSCDVSPSRSSSFSRGRPRRRRASRASRS
jgi:predicted TIM-barrel fold metal-dependent hydrolase